MIAHVLGRIEAALSLYGISRRAALLRDRAAVLILGGFAAGGGVLLSSCGAASKNPRYCDATTACSDPAYPACDPVAHECKAAGTVDLGASCKSASECPDATPICDRGTCRACTGAPDDDACAMHSKSTPRCLAATGACVPCRVDTVGTDCTGATPACDADTHQCRACKDHPECRSGACLPRPRAGW